MSNLYAIAFDLGTKPCIFHWAVFLAKHESDDDSDTFNKYGTLFDVQGCAGKPSTYRLCVTEKVSLRHEITCIGTVLVGVMGVMDDEQAHIQSILDNVPMPQTSTSSSDDRSHAWFAKALSVLQQHDLILEGADISYVHREMRKERLFHSRSKGVLNPPLPEYMSKSVLFPSVPPPSPIQ